MSTSRSTVAVTFLAILGVLAAGWFLLVSPQRSQAAEVRTERAGVEAANAALVVKLNTLKAQAEGLPEQEAKLGELAKRIPATAQLPTVVRALTAQATKSGATLTSITPGAQAVIGAADTVVPVAPADAAAAAPAGPSLTAVPVDLLLSGTFVELERFVNGLEGLERSFLVTAFSLDAEQSTEGDRTLKLALTGRVFTSAGAAAAVTASAPAVSAAPVATASPVATAAPAPVASPAQ